MTSGRSASRICARGRAPARRTGLAVPEAPASELGSAIAEFVMVSALVLVLGIGVFQLGLLLHVRNTLVACAAEGARVGARADATAGEAVARTRSLVTQSLSAAYAEQVTAETVHTQDGIQVVQVDVTAPTPVIGLLGPGGTITVSGRAFAEAQRLGSP